MSIIYHYSICTMEKVNAYIDRKIRKRIRLKLSKDQFSKFYPFWTFLVFDDIFLFYFPLHFPSNSTHQIQIKVSQNILIKILIFLHAMIDIKDISFMRVKSILLVYFKEIPFELNSFSPIKFSFFKKKLHLKNFKKNENMKIFGDMVNK